MYSDSVRSSRFLSSGSTFYQSRSMKILDNLPEHKRHSEKHYHDNKLNHF